MSYDRESLISGIAMRVPNMACLAQAEAETDDSPVGADSVGRIKKVYVCGVCTRSWGQNRLEQ